MQNRLQKRREWPKGGREKISSALALVDTQRTTLKIAAWNSIINSVPIMLRGNKSKENISLETHVDEINLVLSLNSIFFAIVIKLYSKICFPNSLLIET